MRFVAGMLLAALLGSGTASAGGVALGRVLRPGDRVEVKGAFREPGVFVARSLEARREQDTDEELRGRIEAVDPDGQRLTVLGFDVRVPGDAAVLREPDRPASIGELAPGQRVKVDGRREPGGTFVASAVKIRRNQAYDERKLVGALEEVRPLGRGLGTELRLLGLRVLVPPETELVGIRGRSRPVVERRRTMLGGRRVRTAGELRFRSRLRSNRDLDDTIDDRELTSEMFGILGLAFDFGPVYAYVEAAGEREFALRSRAALEERRSGATIGQAYVELAGVLAPWLSLAVGRQKFDEAREWHYNTKHLDAVRMMADFHPLTLEVSLSRDRDRETTHLISRLAWETRGDLRLEGYWLERTDRAALRQSPRIFGLRLLGDPGRHVELWADLAAERGHRSALDRATREIVTRRIDAHAYDVGLTYRPRGRLDPTFTASYAVGSGEGDDVRDGSPDRTFRQSDLQRNKGKYNGVVSFHYYGEVVDPELTNLRILTLAAGVRPWRWLSVDLLHHRYAQDRPSRRLSGTDLDGDPEGRERGLGDEWDLVFGYEPNRRFELRLIAGRFEPGPAFAPELSAAAVVRLRARMRF